jgi:hypothetical protein
MSYEDLDAQGFCLVTLDDPSPVQEIREKLLRELRAFLGVPDVTLETYHRLAAVQARMAELLRRERWHLEVFRRNQALFSSLVGPDLDVESAPYLRLVRPGKPEDNIGMHRDTIYGGSPYEISVLIPFVDLDEGAALRLEPGSNAKAERDIPFVPIPPADPSVTRGSTKHKLGFLYAPKALDPSYPLKAVPVPMRVGQALAFCLSTLHGSDLNRSTSTRWSCDARAMNAFAPVKRPKEGVFTPVFRSALTRSAERYLRANEDAR